MAEDFGSQQKFFMESSLATLGSSVETLASAKQPPADLEGFSSTLYVCLCKILGVVLR